MGGRSSASLRSHARYFSVAFKLFNAVQSLRSVQADFRTLKIAPASGKPQEVVAYRGRVSYCFIIAENLRESSRLHDAFRTSYTAVLTAAITGWGHLDQPRVKIWIATYPCSKHSRFRNSGNVEFTMLNSSVA
jgi:hypothetical protein